MTRFRYFICTSFMWNNWIEIYNMYIYHIYQWLKLNYGFKTISLSMWLSCFQLRNDIKHPMKAVIARATLAISQNVHRTEKYFRHVISSNYSNRKVNSQIYERVIGLRSNLTCEIIYYAPTTITCEFECTQTNLLRRCKSINNSGYSNSN